MQTKISVIIPCYNNEQYLRDCLDSVVGQTFKDIEIIAINDGSKDKTAIIIDEYAKKDARVVFINRENKGVGYSENEGIRRAKGEYVAFLDSDDYYHIDFLGNAYKALDELKYDIVRCNRVDFTGSEQRGNYKQTEIKFADEDYYNLNTNARDRTLFKFPNTIWTSIYRRNFLLENQIFWNENVSSYNDNGFYFQTLALAQNIIYLDITATYYRRDNEASTVKDPDKMLSNFFIEHEFIVSNLKHRGLYECFKENLAERFYINYRNALNIIPFDKKYNYILKAGDSIRKLFYFSGYEEKNFSVSYYKNILQLAYEPTLFFKNYLSDKYKISVIIFVNNSLSGFRKTLECVINQTLKGIEIILVDTGILTGAYKIINEFKNIDSRINLVREADIGRDSAQSAGVGAAHGTYLVLLNSGVYIKPDMLNYVYKKIVKENLNTAYLYDKVKITDNLPKSLVWKKHA